MVKGGNNYYYECYDREGAMVFKGTMDEVINELKGCAGKDRTIAKNARIGRRLANGWMLIRTNEKQHAVYTIEYTGEIHSGTSYELMNKLGISRTRVQDLNDEYIRKLRNLEDERERIDTIVSMIKHYVSLPPCYKTFYHLSDDDDALKRALGDDYKFTHIKNKKEGWNYWEITYADL